MKPVTEFMNPERALLVRLQEKSRDGDRIQIALLPWLASEVGVGGVSPKGIRLFFPWSIVYSARQEPQS